MQSFSELPHIAAHLLGQEAAGDAKVYQRATSVSPPTLVLETADLFPLLLRTNCNNTIRMLTTRILIPLTCWLSARLSDIHWREKKPGPQQLLCPVEGYAIWNLVFQC